MCAMNNPQASKVFRRYVVIKNFLQENPSRGRFYETGSAVIYG
jgi:hypothetical protein